MIQGFASYDAAKTQSWHAFCMYITNLFSILQTEDFYSKVYTFQNIIRLM